VVDVDTPVRTIDFTSPWRTGRELEYIERVIESGQLFGAGPFNERCAAWLAEHTGAAAALTTPSGTHALELAALALDVGPGDEVIMPSFTFVSTANAFALRGAVPVFVDVRPDTLNLDERLLEGAITARTCAIVPVHYAGVGCEMDAILALARDRGLAVVEDAAHALGCRYRGRALGTLGDLGCISFDGQKNVTCGEGGALLVRDDGGLADRVVNIQAKGTNRAEFLRGEVELYEWVELGSAFLPSELTAAFLAAQLESFAEINARRLRTWELYRSGLGDLEQSERLTLPTVPVGSEHSGHLFYVLLEDAELRPTFLRALADRGVQALSHFVPLHSSPAGRRLGRATGALPVTDSVAARLVRLPMNPHLSDEDVAHVLTAVHEAVEAGSDA
jgi:dTDP-4-amino-4,6-dideoxygalactose transaminase